MSEELVLIDKPKEDEHKEILEEIFAEVKALRAELKKALSKSKTVSADDNVG